MALIGSWKELLVNQSKRVDLEGFPKPSRSIGRIANDLIARGCAGKILAVVTHAAYLIADDGEIFWLAHETLPMHPRAILAEFDENTLRVGMDFSARDGRVRLADRLTIDCTTAERWLPAPIKPARVAPPAKLRARGDASSKLYGTSLPIANVARACREKNIPAVAEQSKALIGLGAGLTPAGDDFIGGLLFAAHHLNRAYRLRWDRDSFDELLAYARTQTNQISFTILRDHACGEGVEPLHTWLAAMLDEPERSDLATHARRVSAIGDTSGKEMLAGALIGITLVT